MRRYILWIWRAISVLLVICGTILLFMVKDEVCLPAVFGTLTICVPLPFWYVTLLCVLIVSHLFLGKKSIERKRMLRSMRFRLMLWYALVLTSALFVFGYVVYSLEEYALSSTINVRIQTRMAQLKKLYDPQNNRLSPGANLQQESGDKEIIVLIIPQGHIIQSFGPASATLLSSLVSHVVTISPSDAQAAHWQSPEVWFYQPTGTMGSLVASYQLMSTHFYLSLGPPMRKTDITYGVACTPLFNSAHQLQAMLIFGIQSDLPYQLNDLFWILLFAYLPILFISSFGSYWLASRAMHPVQVITRMARLISETDLHQRLNLGRRDELGELAATFDRMVERLEAAFARQRQFTADASHELRTPLAVVNVEATRILSRERTAQEYQQAIRIMQDANQHMARLVNSLLVLARADSGQKVFTSEEVDIAEVVVDAVGRLATLAQQNHLNITMNTLPELVVGGNSFYLTQLLTNIIENALKYTSGVGAQISIEVSARSKDQQQWAQILVSDDGPGIASEHLPHLFERFYRVDSVRTPVHAHGASESTGSGLGLSIAEWIVQAHGGAIQVRSEVGHGTVFEIWLPLASSLV